MFGKYKSGPIRTEFKPKYLHRKVSNSKQTARKTELFMADRHGRQRLTYLNFSVTQDRGCLLSRI